MSGGIVNQLSDEAVRRVDAISFGTVVATILGWLPHIAAVASIIWFILRIRNELLEHRIKKQEFQINQRRLDQ